MSEKKPCVCIIVENLPVPLDRRVWQESCALRDAGHEVLLHMPMEPIAGPNNNPGPNALLIALDQGEIVRRFRWAMDRVPGAVGFNDLLPEEIDGRIKAP